MDETVLKGYDTICTSRNRVQKEVPMGPLSKVGSKSLLGVHSPDEVMTPFGRWCLEGIRSLISKGMGRIIPLTSLQSGGGGAMVVCTTCTLCTRGIRYTTTHHAEEISHQMSRCTPEISHSIRCPKWRYHQLDQLHNEYETPCM